MDLTNKLYKVFLIAGSEPLGTAGMQADIKSISACGGYAAGAITCIVDEDTIKVKSIQTIPVEMVVSQTYSFLEDVGADCIKTGMLYSQELVTAIGDVVKKQSIPIVVDPVMVFLPATSCCRTMQSRPTRIVFSPILPSSRPTGEKPTCYWERA